MTTECSIKWGTSSDTNATIIEESSMAGMLNAKLKKTGCCRCGLINYQVSFGICHPANQDTLLCHVSLVTSAVVSTVLGQQACLLSQS